MLAASIVISFRSVLLQEQAYYPPNNVTKRCRSEDLPDKDLWSKHPVRIFAHTGQQQYPYIVLYLSYRLGVMVH